MNIFIGFPYTSRHKNQYSVLIELVQSRSNHTKTIVFWGDRSCSFWLLPLRHLIAAVTRFIQPTNVGWEARHRIIIGLFAIWAFAKFSGCRIKLIGGIGWRLKRYWADVLVVGHFGSDNHAPKGIAIETGNNTDL